jgi:ATP-binding cassette, subfamily B, multidrug efflux pump
VGMRFTFGKQYLFVNNFSIDYCFFILLIAMKKLKLLLPYIFKYKYIIIMGFIFVTISNISSTSVPGYIGRAVDYFKTSNYTKDDILKTIGIILLLTILSGFFMYLTRRTIIVVSRYIEYDLRKDFLDSIMGKTQTYFNKNATGSLMALATNDISAARDFFGPAVMYGANTVTTFSFALYFMFSINTEMTFIVLVPLPLLAIFVYLIGNKIHNAFKDAQDHYSKITSQAQESFSGIRIIKSYLREDYESIEFDKLSKSYITKNMKLAKYQALLFPVMLIIVGITQILILGYGGYKVINNTLTLGQLTQFFIYLNLLIWPIAAIGWISNVIQRASASAGRLNDLVFSDENKEAENNNKVKNIVPEIKINNLTFAYENAKILDKISFNIPKGTVLGVIGGVGSGKTTLASIIAGLYQNYSGEINFGENELKSIDLNILRDNLSIVQQEPFLFSMTISENLRFAKPDASDEEIIDICKSVNLDEEIKTFQDAYNTLLGERGITLSGGQKQRLSIARALLKNPKILILDDALSAVDANTEKFIINELRKYFAGRTTIIISHRISTVRYADNIIVLDNGRIIESGNNDTLLGIRGKYYDMYNIQELEEEISHLQ